MTTHYYSIDSAALRKAAQQLLTIDRAGYGYQFDRELNDLTNGDPEFRANEANNYFWLSLRGNELDRFATRLASMMCCPVEQARGVAAELLGFVPRRQIALELLRRLAGEVRRSEAQFARKQFGRTVK